eukprot:gene8706-6122_t
MAMCPTITSFLLAAYLRSQGSGSTKRIEIQYFEAKIKTIKKGNQVNMFGRKNEAKSTLPVHPTFAFQDQPAKPVNVQEQEKMKAKVFVEESRSRIINSQKTIQDFQNSYWFYGYFLSTMSATMLCTMALGSRIPFMQRYAGWISLLGGYGGATGCTFVHRRYLTNQLKQVVEHEITTAKRLDEASGHSLGEYSLEIRRLENIMTAMAARGNQEGQSQAQVEEESAEEIAARYAKKMNWNVKNPAQQN